MFSITVMFTVTHHSQHHWDLDTNWNCGCQNCRLLCMNYKFLLQGYVPQLLDAVKLWGGPKYFQNLNLPSKRDIVQDSATRYSKPTIFWTSLPSDIALHAFCLIFWYFFLSVCRCVCQIFLKNCNGWSQRRHVCVKFCFLVGKTQLKLSQC
jgi:hypothetical protein